MRFNLYASKALDSFLSNIAFQIVLFYISGANLDEWSAANIVIKANILPPNLYVTLEKRKEKMWREKRTTEKRYRDLQSI